ncbi:MAG: adenylate/guanylate cyclase domain-containing protein [Bradyrhizobium sp.]
MVWARLSTSANSILTRILSYGTKPYSERTARRLRQINGFNAMVVILYGVFAAFYASLDWQALKPQVIAVVATMPLFVIPPLLHRFNDYAAIVAIAVINIVAILLYAYILGAEAGVHFFLFAAPAAIVFFGPQHVRIATLVNVFFVLAFLLVELYFPSQSSIAPFSPAVGREIKIACVTATMTLILTAVYFSIRMVENAEAALEREFDRTENLLLNLMPTSIALRLKRNPNEIIADHFEAVTILFADIVGFTPRASQLPPRDVVGYLNRVFSEFDRLAEKYRLEKIKTIGDAYMVAGGMPDPRGGHAEDVANMALDILEVTRNLGAELQDELAVRVGIHTGPAVAGVIGTRKLFYDVWGDTVNTASRMESHGSAGKIQVTEDARRALGDAFQFEYRGAVEIRGKGAMELYYLTGRN